MKFQDDLTALAERVSRETSRAYIYSADMLPLDRQHLLSQMILQGNTSAMKLAEVEGLLLDALDPGKAGGVITGQAGMDERLRWQDSERLEKAVGTILGNGKPEGAQRADVQRVARSEVLETGQSAYHDVIQGAKAVEGWIRALEKEPCQLCQWWDRDGRVWPKAHPMPRHTGDACTQRPVISDDIPDTELTKKMKRRADAIANADRRSAEVRRIQAEQD